MDTVSMPVPSPDKYRGEDSRKEIEMLFMQNAASFITRQTKINLRSGNQ